MKREEYMEAVMKLRRNTEDLRVLLENEEPREELLLKCYQVRARCADVIQYHKERGVKLDN